MEYQWNVRIGIVGDGEIKLASFIRLQHLLKTTTKKEIDACKQFVENAANTEEICFTIVFEIHSTLEYFWSNIAWSATFWEQEFWFSFIDCETKIH